MKNLFSFLGFILLAACFTSCDVVHFNKYPGVMQDSIPEGFRGEFVMDFKKAEKDSSEAITIFIGKNSYTVIEKEAVEIKFLNDSIVFSKLGKDYYLSEKQNNFWAVNFLSIDGNNLKVYLLEVDGKDKKTKLKILKKYFTNVKVQQIENRPTFLADMNEEKIQKYISKELNKKGVTLKRVE